MSFWRLFHNLIRHDDSEPETERATEACGWLADNFLSIRKISSSQQIEILSQIHNFWFNQKSAPSLQILKETLERKTNQPGTLELLGQYEEQEALVIHSTQDLGQLLSDMVEEWQGEKLHHALKISRKINSGEPWTDPKTKKVYSGPMDAAKFLTEQLENGLSARVRQATSGALNDTARELFGIYEKNKADRLAGNLRIRTGIRKIDAHVPIKRGDFVGVLGYAGQRKSTLCRTMAYNAALAGFNVLHITLEQSYDEERIIYGLIHSEHEKFAGSKFALCRKSFEDGDFSDEEERFLRDVVLPDLENLPGRLIIRQPMEGNTWPAIKMMAEVIDHSTPIDLLFIDYLALCSTTSRDSKAEMEENIKDAKQTALQFGEGRGVVFLTPIQGNRKGYEEAKDTGGIWDMTGVNQFSEFDKTADLILSTYIDKDLSEGRMIISSVKIRRAGPLKAFEATINLNVGFVVLDAIDVEVGMDAKPKSKARKLEQVFDDIEEAER
ncbi:MAG: hypothetical protein WCQ50_22520 [Spirochaetota bacterium]